MKYYLHDDLRYDYRRVSMIYKIIIAMLIAICIALAIVVSINDRNMNNNLILNVSKVDSQLEENDDVDIQDESSHGYDKVSKVDTIPKKSIISRVCDEVESIVKGEKSDRFKALFHAAFKTLDAEDSTLVLSEEIRLMNYLSLKYDENDFSTVAIDTETKNEEKSSSKEKYLYVIKYKYRPDRKNKYGSAQKVIFNTKGKFKDNSLKTLTVLSS